MVVVSCSAHSPHVFILYYICWASLFPSMPLCCKAQWCGSTGVAGTPDSLPDQVWHSSSFLFTEYQRLLPWRSSSQCEDDHSLLSNVEVKNAYSFTCTPHKSSWHGT